jgi:hypothetical protein
VGSRMCGSGEPGLHRSGMAKTAIAAVEMTNLGWARGASLRVLPCEAHFFSGRRDARAALWMLHVAHTMGSFYVSWVPRRSR